MLASVSAERIKALSEQLEAARRDAKEAEAYAEEMEARLRDEGASLVKTIDNLQARLAEVAAELRFHVDDAVKAWSAHEAAETRAEAAEAERDEALNQLDDAPYVAKPIYKGRDPALPAVQPAPEVEALVEALRGLRGASHELLAAVQETGALDNILPELFPDSIRRGTRKDVGYKRVDAARNNMRAQITLADAALAAMEKEKAND